MSLTQRIALNRMAARKLGLPNLVGVPTLMRLRGLELVRDANKTKHFLNQETEKELREMIAEVLFRQL